MIICKYCENPILDGEEVKVFRWKKESCHLRCYQIYIKMKTIIDLQNAKAFNKVPFIPIREKGDPWQIRNTPEGICPYCEKKIEKNDTIRKFRLIKNKYCHLKCYKDWHRGKWGERIMICLFYLFFLAFTIFGFLEIFEKI